MSYDIFSSEDLRELKLKEPERFCSPVKGGGDYIDLRNLDLAPLADIKIAQMEKTAKITRALLFAAVEAGQSGHPGGSTSKVEQFLSLLLGGVLAFDPLNPKHPGRDRVVWSAGHCSPLLYGAMSLVYESLRRSGRQFSEAAVRPVFPEDLTRFRHPDGPQGHIENHYPLSDVATGSSGHGLSAAGGLAIVHQSCGLDTKVWVLMGDAETEEGMSYEARNILHTVGAKNLIVTLDWNHFGIDGDISEVVESPYINHWSALGWNVIEVDGHNFLELIYAYRLAARGFDNGSPTVVLAHTVKGKFYGSKENTAGSQGSFVKHDEYVSIIRSLGFDVAGEPGRVMEDIEQILENFTDEDQNYLIARLGIGAEKIKPEAKLVKKMKACLPRRLFVKPSSIRRPDNLPPELVFKNGTKVATRKATQAWFKWLMEQTAFFYVGAGDLSKSILTDSAENVYGIINRKNPLGRGMRFGIAEQNMAMMSAALTQDVLPGGYQPVSVFSSYAVFSSIMSNAVRMALLGNYLKPDTKGFFILLAAHDGPETGEDGPTHHGLFWMSLYEAYPGIKVYKPTDANETIEMLFYALEKGEPIALSVSRPDTIVLDRDKHGAPPAREAVNGAYVYKKFNGKGGKKVVLAVCGGQIMMHTMEALPELEAKGLDVKIIAVTSPELFEELRKKNPGKAQEILSDAERSLVVTLHNGWSGFLRPFILSPDHTSRSIGIDCFLKSGTVEEVYKLAELTSKDIVEKVINTTKNF